MYEVEFKVEITEAESKQFPNQCKEHGFSFKKSTAQHDVYIEVTPSPHGGNDVKRYRNEEGTHIYTEKIWEKAQDGTLVRREDEHEVTQEEFEREITKYPDAVHIKKERAWFKGEHGGEMISLTVDSVKFDHSPRMRYFVEAEIGVDDVEKVSETKAKIMGFLKSLLGREEMIESPGMLTMAFKKL
jgi:adenylate cyclase class IV